MHLDLNLLRVFIAVAETGSFTGAAERLYANQSTVSQRIARLEQQIERKLLERTTRSTVLTDDGELLLRYARQIEELAGEIHAEFNDDLLTGEVRLSVPEDFVDAGFADVFARFQRSQPKVKLELRIGLAAEQRAWIESGEVDLAVIRTTDPGSADSALWSEPILWVASHKLSRELARGDHPTIPLVHVPAPCLYREVAMAALTANTIHWHVVMTCPHLEGIRAAVAAGVGVAPLPECATPRGIVTLGERHHFPALPMCNLQLQQYETTAPNEAIEALKEIIRGYRWNRQTATS